MMPVVLPSLHFKEKKVGVGGQTTVLEDAFVPPNFT